MNQLSRCKPLLGTYVDITAFGNVNNEALIQQTTHCFTAIEFIQKMMSFHDSNSELTKINLNAHLAPYKINTHFFSLFSLINSLYFDSKQLFDPCVLSISSKKNHYPTHYSHHSNSPLGDWSNVELGRNYIYFHTPLLIDLGGIAKGYAVDFAISKKMNNIDLIINAGGDIRMTKWKESEVNIRVSKHRYMTTPMLANSVATSASYYNKKSVITHPTNKTIHKNTASISVFSEHCKVADALTKVLWLNASCDDLLKKYNATGLINQKNSAS